MQIRAFLSAAVLSAGIASLTFGQVTGTVKLEGEPPELREVDMSAVRDCAALHADPVYDEAVLVGEDGELENVVISIKPEEGMDLPGEVPTAAAELDQKGCMYAPRVVPLMVGQRLVVKNSDAFLHNVNAQPRSNQGFNIAQPNLNPGQQVPSPRVPETFRVRCDVHPWMTAYIKAMPHPYFARTDEAGNFSIDVAELPDGEYTFVAWHERYGEQEQTVNVEDGKAEVNFTFQAGQAQAEPLARDIVLAMIVTGTEATEASKGCCGSDAAKSGDENKSCGEKKSGCGEKASDEKTAEPSGGEKASASQSDQQKPAAGASCCGG